LIQKRDSSIDDQNMNFREALLGEDLKLL